MSYTDPDSTIYYGTSNNPNHYELDDEESILTRQNKIDAVTDDLTIDCHHLPEYILDNAHEHLEAIVAMLTDGDDDTLGRINDYWSEQAKQYAEWKVDNE